MGSNQDPSPLPFWQVNIPPEERVDVCPEFLQNSSAKDMAIMATRDEDYHVQTWDEAIDIVRTNRLGDFHRRPSELHRYRQYIWNLKREHGSVMDFMLKERLHWAEPVVPRGRKPFQCGDDVAILMNDWPYGIDPRIVHLVVWTKFDLPDDPETEAEIERFVERTFSPGVSMDKCVWFKNPAALKSVHAIEHIHVLLYDPDPEFVHRVTNGDVPRCRQKSDLNGRRS
ncbi:N-acetylglucosamine-induced protein 1 [Cytospora mali]|uniref:N-acetylglucosamine-induced protein 1 n=1 Tax=Cytospora mali TaxID=578113 RepID=A0A194VPT1_CYTMA|nr:N-acetylglucosamine-induced protein 1 [Valsa mali]